MNGVQPLSPALSSLHNFSIFSLPIIFFAQMATYSLFIDNVYFLTSS